MERIEGDNISATNGTPVRIIPNEGLRFRSGSVISTGADTTAVLCLDRNGSVDMNERSNVRIAAYGSRRLTVSFINGDISVHVFEHTDGRSVEALIGATGIIVEGTMFTIGQVTSDSIAVTMLSGHGTVRGVGETQEAMPLEAGYTMIVQDEIVEAGSDDYAISYHILDFNLENMSLFTLQTIEANLEYLASEGIFAAEALDGLTELIQVRTAEQDAAREYEQLLRQQIPEQEQLTIPEVIAPAEISPIDRQPAIPAPDNSQEQHPPWSSTSPAALTVSGA